jgi:hypothetical protein
MEKRLQRILLCVLGTSLSLPYKAVENLTHCPTVIFLALVAVSYANDLDSITSTSTELVNLRRSASTLPSAPPDSLQSQQHGTRSTFEGTDPSRMFLQKS